jgi:hypothetical protein
MFRATVWLLFGVSISCVPVPPAIAEAAPDAKQPRSEPGSLGPNQQLAAVDYAREIRPLLSNSCYACHRPDEASRKADLCLDRMNTCIAWELTIRDSPTDSRGSMCV